MCARRSMSFLQQRFRVGIGIFPVDEPFTAYIALGIVLIFAGILIVVKGKILATA